MSGQPSHRDGLVMGLVALLVTLAGCSGTLAEAGSSPATLPEETIEEHGYVHGNTTEIPITYPVGMAGISRDITVRTWLSGYSRTTDDDVAGFVLYTSPDVTIEDRSLNPLNQLANRELVRFVLNRVATLSAIGGVENVSGLTEVGEQPVTMLGTRTEMVSYEGFADIDGKRTAVVVNIAVVQHGSDVVVALGVHEQGFDERVVHARLSEQTEHDGG